MDGIAFNRHHPLLVRRLHASSVPEMAGDLAFGAKLATSELSAAVSFDAKHVLDLKPQGLHRTSSDPQRIDLAPCCSMNRAFSAARRSASWALTRTRP